MNKTLVLIAIFLCLLGTLSLCWGCAQMLMILPHYSNVSDLAALIFGASLVSIGYMLATDTLTRPYLG